MTNQFPMLTAASGKIDMVALKSTNSHLHKVASHYIGEDGKPIGGSVMLPVDIADRLEQWLVKEDEKNLARMQADEQRRLDEEIKRVNDLNAARARLEEWVKDGGLLNTQENANAIDTFIRTAPELKGRNKFTPQTVDCAISFLGPKGSNVLQWAAPPTAAPPQPEALVEVLGTCSDGLPELPLSTQPARHHSVAQLRNLSARLAATKTKTRDGWHGSGSLFS